MNQQPPSTKLIDLVQKMYDSNQQLIYVADRKVAALLLINAVLISLSATWHLEEYSGAMRIIILLAILLSAVSTAMYLFAIIPRISEHASTSMLHYKGILKNSIDQYAANMAEIDESDLIEDYLRTIYSLSSIQMIKNRYLRLGSESLIGSVMLLAIAFVLHNIL